MPERASGIAWQDLDGEMVLLRVAEAELLGLNDVGRRIWELVDGQRSLDEIAGALAQEFEVSPGTARRDVLRFLEELAGLNAIRWRPA